MRVPSLFLVAAAMVSLTACQPASMEKDMAAYQASVAAEDAKVVQAGAEFMARTAKEPGVVTLPSGLMYKVVSSPDPKAARPTAVDTVTVNYEGTLVDGKVFDSSYERNTPASFPLNRVVEAWQIGIPLMHKGDTYMLYVPAALGYGVQPPPGGPIPPNSVLIFKVQLLDIQGK